MLPLFLLHLLQGIAGFVHDGAAVGQIEGRAPLGVVVAARGYGSALLRLCLPLLPFMSKRGFKVTCIHEQTSHNKHPNRFVFSQLRMAGG